MKNKIRNVAFCLCFMNTLSVCSQMHNDEYVDSCQFHSTIFQDTLNSPQLYRFSAKEGVYTLEIDNQYYELYFMHGWVESGYVLWEKGRAIVRKKYIILKSEGDVITNTFKMKLKRIDCKVNMKEVNIFKSNQLESECFEITYVKNKEFVKRVMW